MVGLPLATVVARLVVPPPLQSAPSASVWMHKGREPEPGVIGLVRANQG